jgi:L-iditol 2-dehydrogenase
MSFALPGIVKIPRRNSFIEGAMQEPVNTVLKAVKKLKLLRGDTVLVAGQGPIGLIFTRLLVLHGMKVVATDLMETRLKLARRWGAKWTFKADDPKLPDRVRQLTSGRGVDAAVLAVPVDAAFFQAQKLVRGEGKVLLFAHTRRGAETAVDLSGVCIDEKDLIGSYSADFTLQKEVARWVFTRKLDVRQLVTHQFPLERTAAAVELAHHPQPDSLKIIVVHDLKAD